MPTSLRLPTRREAPNLLSLVIPAYNEEPVIPHLREHLTPLVDSLPCSVEIIFINDGSKDRTLELLFDWVEADPRVRIINLARNFGHQAALTAGLDSANGDAVVVMDSDLQDPPEVIHDMIREYQNGYDVVYGQRISRGGESIFKRATAWLFYRYVRYFIHRDLPPDTGDFRLISRPCLEALKSMRETHRFVRGMVAWVGFPQIAVRFERSARVAGTTKYSLKKMIAFAWTASVSFSPAPLRLSMVAGFCLAMIGIADGIYAVIAKLLGYYLEPGWTSIMAALCLIGGAILLSIGILGEYIGRIFEEVKGRPLYVVSRRVNFPADLETTTPAEAALRAPSRIGAIK